MNVRIYCVRNKEFEDSGDTQKIDVEDLESCFKLPDNKLLIIGNGEKKILDDCELIGMEEIKK